MARGTLSAVSFPQGTARYPSPRMNTASAAAVEGHARVPHPGGRPSHSAGRGTHGLVVHLHRHHDGRVHTVRQFQRVVFAGDQVELVRVDPVGMHGRDAHHVRPQVPSRRLHGAAHLRRLPAHGLADLQVAADLLREGVPGVQARVAARVAEAAHPFQGPTGVPQRVVHAPIARPVLVDDVSVEAVRVRRHDRVPGGALEDLVLLIETVRGHREGELRFHVRICSFASR